MHIACRLAFCREHYAVFALVGGLVDGAAHDLSADGEGARGAALVQLFVQQHGVVARESSARNVRAGIVGVAHPHDGGMASRACRRPGVGIARLRAAGTRLGGDGKGQDGELFCRPAPHGALQHAAHELCGIVGKGARARVLPPVQQFPARPFDLVDKAQGRVDAAAREGGIGARQLARGIPVAEAAER